MSSKVLTLSLGLFVAASIAGCNKDTSSTESAAVPAAGNGPSTANDASESMLAGSLVLDLEPKDGADLASVQGATLIVEGRPEITAKADSDGVITSPPMLPGSLTLMILSVGGTGLVAQGAAQFGLKLDDVVVTSGAATNLGKKNLQETGGIRGEVTLLDLPNADLEGTLVFVPGTSFAARTDAAGSYVMTGLPPGKYSLSFQRDGLSVTRREGVIVPEGNTVDIGRVVMSLARGPEGSIKVGGATSASIGGIPSQYVSSRTVELEIVFDNDAALMKVSDEPSFLNKEWSTVESNLTWTFASDGPKSIYVMFSDLNGLESSPYSASFYVDTELPVLSGVTILNGWAQTGSTTVYVAPSASDSGTGVSQIRIAATEAGVAGAAWQAISQTVDHVVAAGAGPKTLFVQVRDVAGRVSGIMSDDIVLGDRTEVFSKTYDTNVTLRVAQSPYLLTSGTVFSKDVIIEPGTTVIWQDNATVKFRGKLVAAGTSGSPIILASAQGLTNTSCMSMGATLDNDEAEPGVSRDTLIRHASIRNIRFELNGGTIENSTFSAGTCTSGMGLLAGLSKTGLDVLKIRNNTSTMFGGINVSSGVGTTEITGNSGCFDGIFQGGAGTTGTLVSNNSFSTCTVSSGNFIQLSAGSMTLSNNTFDFPDGNRSLVYVDAAGGATFDGLVVSGNGCLAAVKGTSRAVTLNRANITCKHAVDSSMGATGTVTIDRSTINVSRSLVAFDSVSESREATIRRSTITCAGSGSSGSDMCDMAMIRNPANTVTVTMRLQQNRITCNAAANCRGGFNVTREFGGFAEVKTPTITLDFGGTTLGNYFSHMQPAADIGTNTVPGGVSSGSVVYVFGPFTEIKVYEYDWEGPAVEYINATYNVAPYTNANATLVSGPSVP